MKSINSKEKKKTNVMYYRLIQKGKGNKAVTAASRKLLTCIWHMLTKNEEFKY